MGNTDTYSRFGKAYEFILDRVGGKERMGEDGLVYWRARILTALIATGLVFGLLGFIPLAFLVIKEGLWQLALIDVGAWIVGLSLLVAPDMRYETRAGITLSILYLVGAFIIINVGLLSGGPFFIFTFAVLTSVLLGTRSAMAALFINTITLVAICWLMASGTLNDAFPFFKTTEKMLAAGITIILANAIATISLAVLVKGLVNSAWKEKSMAQALEKERSQLLAAKHDLELEITERNSIETELRESEGKYRDLFSNLPVGIGVTDMEGRILDYNEALLKPGGYDPADVESLESIDTLYYDPTEREQVIEQLADQGVLDGFELRLKKKDGTFYHALLSLRQITINAQTCWHAGIIDVSERKKAEEALRKSENRLDKIIHKTFDIVFSTDEIGTIKSISPQTENVFNVKPDAMIGKPFFEFVHPSDSDRVMQLFLEGMQGKDLGTIQVIGQKADGSPVSLELRYILELEDGNSTGTFGVIRDVTETRHLEEQLRQAHKMEALGTLAGGIAHGFNNLLMGIQGRSSLLMKALGPDSPHFEHLARIEDNVRRAASLTKQILGLARSGKYEVQTLNLLKLIEESLDIFGRTRAEISIRHQLDQNLWAIEADQGQIEQVLIEIYVNAEHFMPDGGQMSVTAENVTLDLSRAESFQLAPGRYVEISIADTGVGMDKDIRQKIFDPFFTTKDMEHETGLGLASAYGIIKNHSGTITVESQKGHGTVFTILLPVSDVEPVKEIPKVATESKASATVLLVDDEQLLIDVGSQMLEAMGHRVMTAEGGEQALKVYAAQREQIDLVILDMMMPDLDGRDTFKALKEIDPAVKVLLSSGYSLDGQATEILDMGCRGFIQKPFNMQELSEKISTVL